tara:strand:+ start:10166 stop:10408 length:243 start_codon:yes stop_codon:yes gene_type:complete
MYLIDAALKKLQEKYLDSSSMWWINRKEDVCYIYFGEGRYLVFKRFDPYEGDVKSNRSFVTQGQCDKMEEMMKKIHKGEK